MDSLAPSPRRADGPANPFALAVGLVGSSPRFLGALERARQFARSPLPILVVGETGTGKELFARYIHSLSGRTGPLVDVNCAALPADLLEGLLFGHRRGAFTGATESVEGLIERSDRGTLFLDELASLPLEGQAKLLRVIENGEVRRVGATSGRFVDFRLVATVQGDPESLLRDGGFRLDLMQRIAGVTIHLPTLDERPEDVVPLARVFASRHGIALTSPAERLLETRSWPGNIRELRWVVERAAVLAAEGPICDATLHHALEMAPARGSQGQSSPRVLDFGDLRAVCGAYLGAPDEIAKALRISRATLYRRLRSAGIHLRSYRSDASTEN